MSKWKDEKVKIIQAFQGPLAGFLFGLGDDEKIYRWSYERGDWEKNWLFNDDPTQRNKG